MRIRRLEVFTARLPLEPGFSHFTGRVTALEEVFVRLTADDGHVGWGEVRGNISISRDVTQQKNDERALRAALGVRDEFLSIASHELRTPLAALSLQVAGLERALSRRAGSDDAPRNLQRASRAMGVLGGVVAQRAGESVVVSTHGNLFALILNALDPKYGYQTWLHLSFPDVYRLSFRADRIQRIERVWRERPPTTPATSPPAQGSG